MEVVKKNPNEDLIERLESVKDELFAYYDTHSYKDTLKKFDIPSYKKLSFVLKSLDYDFSRKKGNSIMKGRPSSRSHDSYVEGGKKSSLTQKSNWERKSDEDKDAWSNLMRESHSSEEYKSLKSKSQREWYASLSEDEKREYARIRGERSKEFWDSLSEERKREETQKRIEAGAGWNHDRIRRTLRERYSVDNVSQIESVKRKAIEGMNKACLEKYGLEWNCQLPQCINAIGAHSSNTKPNVAFAKILDDMHIEYEREFSVGKFIYDFKVCDTLIEINPTATHNSTWSPFGDALDKLYHKDKMMNAEREGYRCIMVWDWDSYEKIARSLVESDVVYARKCEVREIDNVTCVDFVDRYHFQNDARCSIRLGLYHNDELISVMTFGKPRYNKKYDWELIRYCSSKKVVGGARKLFSHFVKEHVDETIVSYCDRSKFSGDLYSNLGFVKIKSGQPSKHWYNIKTKEHYTDNLLRQQGFSRLVHRIDASKDGLDTDDNEVLMLREGFVEIWDCGQDSYAFNAC